MATSDWLPKTAGTPWVPAPVAPFVPSSVPDGGMGMHEGGDTVARGAKGLRVRPNRYRRPDQEPGSQAPPVSPAVERDQGPNRPMGRRSNG